MAQQVQQNMPAHLKKYTQGNNAYVPKHIEKAMTQHVQETMPTHMKKYAGAYVQKQIIAPQTANAMPQSSARLARRPPVPNPLRQDHYQTAGEQFNARLGASAAPVGDPAAQTQAVYPDGQAGPQASSSPQYDFIVNPEKPSRNFSLPGGSSMAVRIGLVAGALIVLFILFSIARGLLSSAPNLEPFVGIAQDQQELLHLANSTNQQTNLTTANQNFSITAQLALADSQKATIQYLQNNGQKVSPKVLALKINAATDERLAASAAATTYNQTFQDIMRTELTTYINNLKQTYGQSKGEKGRALLNDNYNQAQLLLIQLNGQSNN